MRRSQFVKKINKKICGLAKGIFSDLYWEGKNVIINALTELREEGIDFFLNNNKYREENGIAVAKEWVYELTDGKNTCIVLIIASGAGSVKDPLEKYDIVAYAS